MKNSNITDHIKRSFHDLSKSPGRNQSGLGEPHTMKSAYLQAYKNSSFQSIYKTSSASFKKKDISDSTLKFEEDSCIVNDES